MKATRLKSSPQARGRTGLPPTVLLLSEDPALENLVVGVVRQPWTLACKSLTRFLAHQVFAQPSVRLLILDDEAIQESDRSWSLAQICMHFPGCALLYVAGSHSASNEQRARANGAYYYAAKPISHEQFVRVLQSFLQTLQLK
jgi:CheY-like chemotaxis protein